MKCVVQSHFIGCAVCLPPYGGSGLKWQYAKKSAKASESPSIRREWIEISMPPAPKSPQTSPSIRREWIEISFTGNVFPEKTVSLHTEGVD